MSKPTKPKPCAYTEQFERDRPDNWWSVHKWDSLPNTVVNPSYLMIENALDGYDPKDVNDSGNPAMIELMKYYPDLRWRNAHERHMIAQRLLDTYISEKPLQVDPDDGGLWLDSCAYRVGGWLFAILIIGGVLFVAAAASVRFIETGWIW